MRKFKCLVCGVEFEIEDGQQIKCPVCGVDESNVEEIK